MARIQELGRGAVRARCAQRFSRDRMVSDYLDVYDAVLARQQGVLVTSGSQLRGR